MTESFEEFLSQPPTKRYRTTIGGEGSADVQTEEITDSEVLALLERPDTAWYEAFPMIVGLGNDRPLFVVLDSIMAGTNIETNAFGELNERQILLCAELIKNHPQRPMVLSLHHPLGNPKKRLPKGDWILDRGSSIRNAEALIGILPAQRSFVIFNGHRHLAYTGIIDGHITAISGPSATLGNSGVPGEKRKPGIGMYGLMWDDRGSFTHFHENWLK
ncbi:MAG: hypothetical protein ABSF15_24755 [Candidatus Sulfotelmatobacter sp.]